LFVGREIERAALVEAILGADARPIAILGAPGIGKSSLTRWALHDARVVERFGTRRWFVRLDTANEERALWTTILAAITAATPGADPAVQVLARLGDGDGLLVLDNLETPWNADEVRVEEALARLADVLGVRLVASIRGTAWPGRVDWLWLPTLEALPTDKARELFLKIAGGESLADDPDLDAIVEALDGLPLAVDLLARQAQGSRALYGLRADFEERKGKLYEIGEGKERSLEASLQLSLNCPKMTGVGKRLYTTLGRLPAGAAQQDLNKLITGGGQAAGRVLCQLGLAFNDGDRLRMLAPIREHAVLRPMQDVKAVVGHYLDLARSEGKKVGHSGGAEAVARLAPEIANLEAAVDLAIKARLLPKVFAAFGGLARLMRFSGIGSTNALQRLVDADGPTRDQAGLATRQFRLGEIMFDRSQHDEARERFEAALGLYRKVGEVLGEASCIYCLGEITLQHSQHDEARERFEAALGLYCRVGDLLGEANCIQRLGEIALRRSKHDEARTRFEAAIGLYCKVGDVLGEASCIQRLGEIALRRSQHDEARTRFEAALGLYREIGGVMGEAGCIFKLGEIALQRSQHDEARERFEVALGFCRKVGDVNGEALSIWGFGQIAREGGQHAAAEGHFASALALFRQIGGRLGEAMCLLGMGQDAAALASADAQPLLRRALSLFEEVEQLEGRGKALLEVADLEASAEAKRALLLDALDSHSRFGNPRWIGEAHRRLARISDGEERREHVAAAREAWTSIDRLDLVAELDREVNPPVPDRPPSQNNGGARGGSPSPHSSCPPSTRPGAG
jgi:tetratricopeptide (TPR) repeat protein